MHDQRCIIIPCPHDTVGRTLANLMPNGKGMFGTGLSPDGSELATHYVSEGMLPLPGMASYFPLQHWQQDDETGDWTLQESIPGDAQQVYDRISAHLDEGEAMPCTVADIEAMFVAADVTKQPVAVAMRRLGLKLVQQQEEESGPIT